jgi:D-aminopeptidase
MRTCISADMEGVTHPQDVIPGRSQYERFRRLLTADVNAAIEGAARSGATDFLVNEAHDGMRNLLLATASSASSFLFFPGLERADDRTVAWTHETAFEVFIGVMRLSRSDPDYG